MNYKILCLTVVVLALLTGPGQAQTPRATDAAITSRTIHKNPLQNIIPAAKGARFSKRIILVLDGSGSMAGQISAVIGALNTIAGQPIDEMEFAVIVFRGKGGFPGGSSFTRWPGLKEKNLPYGWARMPSVVATVLAVAWVESLGAYGGADPADALENAVLEGRDDLSVVFVSDGIFEPQPVLEKLERAQRARVVAKLNRVVVAVFGIGPGSKDRKALQSIARAGSGGLWVRKPSPAVHPRHTTPARAGPPSPSTRKSRAP